MIKDFEVITCSNLSTKICSVDTKEIGILHQSDTKILHKVFKMIAFRLQFYGSFARSAWAVEYIVCFSTEG